MSASTSTGAYPAPAARLSQPPPNSPSAETASTLEAEAVQNGLLAQAPVVAKVEPIGYSVRAAGCPVITSRPWTFVG